ncbi:SIS domain-containing protein, partial [Trichodelitschia bisporula]
GLHVLRAEALALAHVAGLYESSATAQTGLVRAVGAVAGAQRRGGKLVVCGIGKSGHVGVKLVATLKSLGVGSAFMHAAEAVHGDLGDVREGDVLLFITYSGKTPEMRALTPHLPPRVPVIAICGASAPGGCAFLADRPDAILLPAPIPVSEEAMFGVGAPTISTTVAMAVGDMLALTVAQRLHGERVKGVFGRNHPGGAIGAVGR